MRALGRASIASLLKVVLDVVWYLMIVFAVLMVIDALRGLLGDPTETRLDLLVPVALDQESYRVTSTRFAVEVAHFKDVVGILVLSGASRLLVFVWFAVVLLWVGAVLAVIHQLRKIFATLAGGEPFVRATGARIRFIGLVVIVMELGKSALVLGQSFYLKANLSASGLSFRSVPQIDLAVIFLGLVLLVIAEVFRQGAKMREEQRLTV